MKVQLDELRGSDDLRRWNQRYSEGRDRWIGDAKAEFRRRAYGTPALTAHSHCRLPPPKPRDQHWLASAATAANRLGIASPDPQRCKTYTINKGVSGQRYANRRRKEAERPSPAMCDSDIIYIYMNEKVDNSLCGMRAAAGTVWTGRCVRRRCSHRMPPGLSEWSGRARRAEDGSLLGWGRDGWWHFVLTVDSYVQTGLSQSKRVPGLASEAAWSTD
jgi:hypothetical protein